MTRLRHDPFTQSLHWIVAFAVAGAYGIALLRDDMPKGDLRNWMLTLHMSMGLVVFGLSLLRLGWRTAAPAPAPAPGTPLVRLLAKAAHVGLYLALIAVPVMGLVAAWAKGRGLTFFGLFPIPSPIGIDREFAEEIEDLHGLAAHSMMILAGLHAVAAIGHQFVLKDGTLGRMLPFVRAPQTASAD